MMSGQPTKAAPSVVSLLLCDQVIDDKLTGKKSAIGIFNTIMASQIPTTIQQMVILASVTEISGQAGVELRLIRDTDNQMLFGGKGTVEAPNPLAVVDLLFAMHGVHIPEAGQYAFELLSGGELLARRRFQVRLRQRPTPPSGEAGGPPDSPAEA
jgi:hypothetical protein